MDLTYVAVKDPLERPTGPKQVNHLEYSKLYEGEDDLVMPLGKPGSPVLSMLFNLAYNNLNTYILFKNTNTNNIKLLNK